MNKKTNSHLPFDFCIKKLKLIIELDGDQHFRQVSNWRSPKVNQKRDKYKMKKAIKHGYSIIRILQRDVYNNKNKWDTRLIDQIKLYIEPVIICNGKDYECFQTQSNIIIVD